MEEHASGREVEPSFVWRRHASVTSRDGVEVVFTQKTYLEGPLDGKPEIRVEAGETYMPIHPRILTDFGDGDREAGIQALADAVTELDFQGIEVGDHSPLFREVVIPYYGGQEAFHAAMDDQDTH